MAAIVIEKPDLSLMKNRILILTILFNLNLHGQNYHPFPNPTDTIAFADVNAVISHLKFDSIISSGSTTTYYPISELATDDADSCYGRINGNGWLGNRIIDSSGYWYFDHKHYQLEINTKLSQPFVTQAGWLHYNYQQYDLQLQLDSTAYETIPGGGSDSLRYYQLSLIDTAGQVFYKFPILLARNQGLQQFPYFSGHRINLNSFSVFSRIDFSIPSKLQLYDFAIGEVFHYFSSKRSLSTYALKEYRKLSREVVDKQWFPAQDSVYYTFLDTWNDYRPISAPPGDSVQGVDTSYFGFSGASQPARKLFSFQGEYPANYQMMSSPSFIEWQTDILVGRPGYFEYDQFAEADTATGCFHPGFEMPNRERFYATGLGLIKEEYIDYGNSSFYGKNLLYFKKGSQSWGTPLEFIGLEEELLEPLMLYPNPASDWVEIELPKGSNGIEISVLNQLGQVLKQQVISGPKSRISIEDLPAGVYLLQSPQGTIRLVHY